MTGGGRQVRRRQTKERMKAMKIKRKAIQVTLSDQETIVTVHAPSMEQFTEFMASFGILDKVGKAFAAVQNFGGGVNYDLSAIHLDKATMEEFYPLLAGLSDISVEDFKALPVEDGLSIMMAYITLLSPASLNPTPAEPEPSQAPPPQT